MVGSLCDASCGGRYPVASPAAMDTAALRPPDRGAVYDGSVPRLVSSIPKGLGTRPGGFFP